MESEGSVTHWIEQVKAGNESVAQQELWNRYFARLVALARNKLAGVPRREADEEDVALVALNSFFRGAQRGQFPKLRDRTNLWPSLVKITARKAVNERKRQRAAKRGRGKIRGESVLVTPVGDDQVRGMEQIAGKEPTPDFAGKVAEECHRLFQQLDDETLRRIARLKLEGYRNAEIAAQLGVTQRPIERKLSLIRKHWSEDYSR